MSLWKAPLVNAFTSSLNGGISASDNTIALASVSGLQAPGVILIDRVDSNNTSTPLIREHISFTGISGNTLTGCTRGLGGSTAQAHNSGAKIEVQIDVTMWGGLVDAFLVSHTNTGAIVGSTATLTDARVITSLNASGASITLGDVTLTGRINLSGASIATGANFGFYPMWTARFMDSGFATPFDAFPIPMPVNGKFTHFVTTTKKAYTQDITAILFRNGTPIFADFIPSGTTFSSNASYSPSYTAGEMVSLFVGTSYSGVTQIDVDLSVMGVSR